MRLDLTSYRRADGETFRFEKVGDRLTGTVTHLSEPFESTSKFTGDVEEMFVIGVTDADGQQWLLWPRLRPRRSILAGAIIDATDGQPAIGGNIDIIHDRTEDTGKGNPAKLFTVTYEPPANEPASPGHTDDEDPF